MTVQLIFPNAQATSVRQLSASRTVFHTFYTPYQMDCDFPFRCLSFPLNLEFLQGEVGPIPLGNFRNLNCALNIAGIQGTNTVLDKRKDRPNGKIPKKAGLVSFLKFLIMVL